MLLITYEYPKLTLTAAFQSYAKRAFEPDWYIKFTMSIQGSNLLVPQSSATALAK